MARDEQTTLTDSPYAAARLVAALALWAMLADETVRNRLFRRQQTG